MRTSERLRNLKEWTYKELCQGRIMKAPGKNIMDVVTQEPKCFLAWYPSRPNETGYGSLDPLSTTPSILIMPATSHAKFVEEKRFDRYNNIRRNQEFGQNLTVQMLFSVYEPGIRLEGFDKGYTSTGLDVTKIMEGTEEGLMTLTNWMDDCLEKLLGIKMIPGTDLCIDETTATYGLYMDESYVVDKRPIYYGFVNATFAGFAESEPNNEILDLLL